MTEQSFDPLTHSEPDDYPIEVVRVSDASIEATRRHGHDPLDESRCRTCDRLADDPEALFCSNSIHLGRLPDPVEDPLDESAAINERMRQSYNAETLRSRTRSIEPLIESATVTFTDADIAVAVADLYARAARLQQELAPMGVTVTVNVSVRIAADG